MLVTRLVARERARVTQRASRRALSAAAGSASPPPPSAAAAATTTLPPPPAGGDVVSWHAWVYDSFPVQGMQGVLETLQEATGLPWWASIVTSTLAFRVALLPVVRYQAHALARLARSGPLLVALNQALSKRVDAIRPGDVAATTAACRRYAAGVSATLKLHEVSLLAALASPLVQLPVFITFALANRRMIDTQVPGLDSGGLAWFEDLTEPDPLLVLPAVCLASTYMNLELGFARLHESQTVLRFLKDNLQLFLILGAPVSSTLPAGVFVYWFTSSMYGHAQHFALRNASVRQALGFPGLAALPPSSKAVAAGEGEGEGGSPPPLPPAPSKTRGGSAGGAGVLVDPRLLSRAFKAIDGYEAKRALQLARSTQRAERGAGKKEGGAGAAAPPPVVLKTHPGGGKK